MKTIATLYVFASDSSPGKTYQTLQYTDATTSCECPGWKFKRKNTPDGQRTCKHTRWVDCGQVEGHALTMKQYAKVAQSPNVNTRTAPGISTGRRAIELED